jgi:tripartite-type tricarboxylate transporter receptor subunit TctC
MRFEHATALRLVCVALGLQLAMPAMAQDPAEHFKGKVIKLVIPTGPGGAYGLYGLLFAQHFGRHVPGNPAVTPEYRSGAGGIVASNYLYGVAPRDGTVIGIPLAPFVLAQFNGSPNVNYDAAKFNWIGQIGTITRLFAVWSTSSIKTFDDLTKQELNVGSTGRGSETYMNPALINSVFGAKTRIIGGYKGSRDLMLAMERGEIGGATSTWGNFAGNHQDWMRDGKIRFIVQIGLSKVPQVGNVPLLQDLAKSVEDRRLIEFMSLATTAVGYSVLTPPGVPGPLVDALRRSFDATMKDPAFLADAKKRNIDLDPASHESVAAAVAKAAQSPKALVQRFNSIIK